MLYQHSQPGMVVADSPVRAMVDHVVAVLARGRRAGELLSSADAISVTQHLLTPKTRIPARKVIDRVVQERRKQLEVRVEQAISGALRKDRHSPRRVLRNLDLKTTLRRNLRNWNEERRKLFIDRVFFYVAEKNKRPWHVIVCVDQSGSMLESAIFSAVMASIFAELPGVKTSLVLFDTQVVDLTDKVGAPVDVLLSVHLGGGTDITRALEYCSGLVRPRPRRCAGRVQLSLAGPPVQRAGRGGPPAGRQGERLQRWA